ncbi:hypothetical protein [Aquibacillus saliphilus]|uniref:hypothetical protein n=1 Tax=Aquibacillus saliphilus TaxID=1909422 RepID=UPI001CF03E83|nr:hypothetical protein [Aquibacillus saliphilus]
MNTMTIRTLKNKDLSKILDRFTAHTDARPVLEFAYFDLTSLWATDSHQMIKIDKSFIEYMDSHYANKTHFYNPDEQTPCGTDHNYPDVTRIYEGTKSYQSEAIIKLDINQLRNFESFFKTAKDELKYKRYNFLTKFMVEDNNVFLQVTNDQQEVCKEKLECDSEVYKGKLNINFNTKYLLNSIQSFKKALQLSNGTHVEIDLKGRMKPSIWRLNNELMETMVLPVRTY